MTATLAIRMDNYVGFEPEANPYYVYTIDDAGYRIMLAEELDAEMAARVASHLSALPRDVVAALVRQCGGKACLTTRIV